MQIADECGDMEFMKEGRNGSLRIIQDVDGGTKVVQVSSQSQEKTEEETISTEEVPMEVGE